ncbi:Piso0_005742 [Millerozyma farinosa CBS 7064]|uniref:glucan endo-1,3-beta-D-glucosidase n=1 Tax=Pichia sorbitophila (strain ATCC MYA-4447 / BCRC 22081 / CBS 7064 / NBRC 10061 / NRRL Y-12695) TaxID=559304 RepID=G8XZU0_PICSO|nr:Piso0_005742 [Millerozyma farinosa CBS 7064]
MVSSVFNLGKIAHKMVHTKDTDIFSKPVSSDEPLSIFEKKGGETAVPSGISNSSPLQTNSFYSNFFVDTQDAGVWTHPYSVAYSHKKYYGLMLYHSQTSDRVFGKGDPPEYYYSPTGIKEFVYSASEFNDKTKFSVVNMSKFAATARFSSNDGTLDCPLVQGMGFVTGVYKKLTPQINTQLEISSFSEESSPKDGIKKFKVGLNNKTTWTLYATVPNGQKLDLKKSDSHTIKASSSVSDVVLQLAFGDDSTYDKAAGKYQTDCAISATVKDSSCTYSLSYKTSGSSSGGTGLIFGLSHHVASVTKDTGSKKTKLSLPSTTKGDMTGFLTDKLEMSESLNDKLGFDPYTTIPDKSANYSDKAKDAIKEAAKSEANGDVVTESDVNSMYTSGKILAKYALILYTVHYVLKDEDTTKSLLGNMKKAIERFVKNKQQYPLFYDTNFKGIVSSAKEGNDFGNGHYNDHHFHYGYHIHAAAIVSKVDKDLGGSWLDSVKPWVSDLIRDVANPSTDDKYFPVSRSFDFFNGHSWAKGLYLSADGKDEESSSEDYNFAYAMKCWGNVVEDSSMEHRADLMIAIMKRAMNSYFLYSDDNKVEPSKIIPNKVSGILFENKIHHTTYFGNEIQYIQGIHMLPITPVSSIIRGPTFVKQEWDEKLKDVAGKVNDGWKSILMLNVALYDPTTAYKFFSDGSFNKKLLDNGLSRTWALTYCAGVGASS